ncbi:hypothetical protein CVT91_00595 [Candidatus Atribacteria bacterium HGW-Atribacteria-1]|nr:MAG: hypothetical protein CVT91_00595 [Candidatus Atribacteria bacterium HGW-Atribacteria-1]
MTNSYNILTNAAFKYCELSPEDKDNIIDLYKEDGQQSIYESAKKKKILPFVAVLLSRLEIDKAFWVDVAAEYRKRNEDVIGCLDTIFNKLSDNGVRKVFVTENFGALLASDADKALFSSGDVDMYADIAQKEEIYKSFEQLGYTMIERYSHKKLISTSFYNDDILSGGFHFGVAWNPLSRMKLPCFVDADDFVEWDKLWKYKDTAINLPNIDALMYICLLHISLHSFSRAPDIRLYIDINNVSKLPVDWEKIISFAKRDNTMVRVLTACILAKKLLSVNVPEFVLNYRAQYERSISRLLKLIYDEKYNCLLYEPGGIKVLKIEVLADNGNLFFDFIKILFPNRKWVKEFYVGDKGSLIVAYLKHIKNLF